MATRWEQTSAPRGDEYDARWTAMAADGANIHGEADLVTHLLADRPGASILDAGCGTGRVAIELAARGFSVTGVDSDDGMLATARQKAPGLRWITGDLADLPTAVTGPFDLVLLAGNVMIFLTPGTESAVVERLAGLVADDGYVVAGYSLSDGRLPLVTYDGHHSRAGTTLVDRWATWDRDPYAGGDYAVSVHARRR